MSRYIDADKLLTDELTHTLPVGCGRSSGKVVVFVEDIEKIPTADVVEVVRCKDCKESEICPDTLMWCNQWERLVPPIGFCHCGERSEKCSSK